MGKSGLFGRIFGRNKSDDKNTDISVTNENCSIKKQSTYVDEKNVSVEGIEDIKNNENLLDNEEYENSQQNDLKLEEQTVSSDVNIYKKQDSNFNDEFIVKKESGNNQETLSWFGRLSKGLSRSSGGLTASLTSIFTKKRLDSELLQELEDALIQADLGVDTAISITEQLANEKYDKETTIDEVKQIVISNIIDILNPVAKPLNIDVTKKPHTILMVGVNGAGKTTTIGKFASQFKSKGKKIMLAAGDTFRAAAIEQLQIWGERNNVPVISRDVGADSSGLAYDALKQAKEQEIDVLLIDTAGRLQNKSHLMAELEKIVRVLRKQDPTAPHSVILVLDATTGQNAMSQVEIFKQSADVTGIVMTKLDGTARGGILVAVAAKFGLPIHAIGVGEAIDDLQSFIPEEFAQAIIGD